MGVEDAVHAGGGGKKLTLASISFAGVLAGAGGGGAVYKDGLLVVGLPVPGGSGLDVAGAVPEVAVRLPDVGAAFRTFLRKREVAEFVSGAMAGAMTKAVLAPLETIRRIRETDLSKKDGRISVEASIYACGWPFESSAVSAGRLPLRLSPYTSIKQTIQNVCMQEMRMQLHARDAHASWPCTCGVNYQHSNHATN